jgi:alpha-beta hydrolase superfamily lysophospholipase
MPAPGAITSRPGRPRRRRRRRRLIAIALGLALVVVALAGVVAVSWGFSSRLLDPDHSAGPYGVAVERVAVRERRGSGLVGFERSEAGARPGLYGLDFPGGHAIARDIEADVEGEVTRRVTSLRGRLDKGTKVAFDAAVWTGTPRTARDILYRSIRFRSPLGPMPAWRVAGPRDTWAIFVHGHNVTRTEGLRVLSSLHAAGLPTLLIAYRNDPGAPRSKDGLLHLGATEWQDVDAAARYAVGHGARSLVVLGDSMGGAIVSQFVHESPLAARVRALILDAPVLDWRAVLALQASERGLPGFLATTTRWAVSLRIGLDWGAFDQVARARQFRMPILLFHGTEDHTVPISSSDAFARALPGRVTYYRVPGAGHVEAWNVDPERYDARVRAFLARVMSTP